MIPRQNSLKTKCADNAMVPMFKVRYQINNNYSYPLQHIVWLGGSIDVVESVYNCHPPAIKEMDSK
jgi:hypothetical protein